MLLQHLPAALPPAGVSASWKGRSQASGMGPSDLPAELTQPARSPAPGAGLAQTLGAEIYPLAGGLEMAECSGSVLAKVSPLGR